MRRFALAVMLLAGLTPAFAADIYGYELKAKEPKAFHAWQTIVPKPLRKTAWIYKLKGTATPTAGKTVGGKDLIAGWVCKPHDCGDNGVTFLLAADGSHAVGSSRLKAAQNSTYFGAPTDDEKAALDALYTPH